jgi:hypothetical protein
VELKEVPRCKQECQPEHSLDRGKLSQSLLQSFDQCFETLTKLSQADIQAITKIVKSPEYAALLRYYDNLIFKQYKQAIIDEDLKLAKSMVKLLSVLRNYPRVLVQNYDYVTKSSTEAGGEGTGFSDDLKANGEEFI